MSTGLSVEHLVLGDGTSAPVHIAAPPGTVVAVLGPSGGARTRLLMTVAGRIAPVGGLVTFDGAPVRAADVGVLDEDHSLVGGLSAMENLAVRLLARHELTDADWSGSAALLESLGLPPSSWHNLVEQLSGGQQQRVALARALVDAPALLCLDDPTSELDPTSARLAWARIDAAAVGGAVVVVGLIALQPPAHADLVVVPGA